MRLPAILMLICFVTSALATRAGLEDVALIAGIAGLAALSLLFGAWLRRPCGAAARRPRRPTSGRRGSFRPRSDRIIVDGSNVMHWRDGEPDLAAVRAVVAELSRRGFAPIVWFDANAGWKTAGRYLGPAEIAPVLGLPPDDVRVVGRGRPADPEIIAASLKLRAPIVSNDQFRDWRAEHPRLDIADRLIPGGLSGETVRLRMSA